MKLKSSDPGVLLSSASFFFTPSEIAKRLYLYPTWCGHYHCTSDYFVKREFFPDLLLAYVRKGEFLVDYGGGHYAVTKGEVLFIDCQFPHYYRAAENLEFLFIHISGSNSHELAQHLISQYGVIYRGDIAVEIGAALVELVKRCEKDEVIPAPEFSALCYRLITTLARRTSSASEGGREKVVARSVRYIRENVGKSITLDDLSRHARLSKYHFLHVFKAETGYTPMEYVISTKLDRAKVLLKTSDRTVSEIAYEVGYKLPSSFITLFTGKEGCSPTAFRKA